MGHKTVATNLTDLKISKALALAIGWTENVLEMHHDGYLYVDVSPMYHWAQEWRRFDYRDWNVIGPIATRYDCFPGNSKTLGWFANVCRHGGGYADTPQKAIALAVIGAKK